MKIIPLTLSLSGVFLLLLLAVNPARAHGVEPRLEISLERVNPGGVVDVRGVDFAIEERISLLLVNSQTAIPLGEITADLEGTFIQNIAIPVDLVEGTYNFLALTDDHNITSPDLIVQGPPILAEEGSGQGLRDQEDGLLAPMPTFPPGYVPDGPPAPTPTVPASTGSGGVNLPFVVTGVAFFLLGILLVAIQRRRTR